MVRHTVDYEADAAIELESVARAVIDVDLYSFALAHSDAGTVADPAPVIRAVVADVRRAVPAGPFPGVWPPCRPGASLPER